MKVRSDCLCLSGVGLCQKLPSLLNPERPFLLQGVEFFDEKLNSLCMAWLVDHGEYPQWAVGGDRGSRKDGWQIGWGWCREWWRLESSPMAPDVHVDQFPCSLESRRSVR